jgi:hypothetical protein
MNRELVSRIGAALLLAAAFAAVFGSWDQSRLAQMQAMTPQEYYDRAKHLVSEPFAFRALAFAILGVVYVICVEALAWLLRRGWRDKRIA